MRAIKWALALWIAAGVAALADAPDRGIIVTGEGQVSVAPDMASISLGVTHRADTAKGAVTQTANAVAGILSALEEKGVQARDLQTSRFYLNPVWSNPAQGKEETRVIEGYEAGNSVTVTVRDLRDLGAVLDAAVDLGGNNFNGLQFGLKDDAAARAEARKAAVADAIARANQLAEAAGLRLGSVLRMTEQGYGQAPVAFEMARSSAMGDSIASGEIAVSAQVEMVFQMRPNI